MKKYLCFFLACCLLLSACSSASSSAAVTTSASGQTAVSAETTQAAAADVATEKAEQAAADTTPETIPEATDTTSQELTDEVSDTNTIAEETVPETEPLELREIIPDFQSLNDPNLLRYVEDNVYASSVEALNDSGYFIENVSAVYVSKEYIEELEYNSKVNVFFGYTIEELDEQFRGTRYVFTLGSNGETVVEPFEEYDDVYIAAMKNVAIGTGVILVCITVSAATGGLGAPAVSMVFAASAKTGAIMALSSGTLGAVSAGIVTGVQQKDMNKALKAAATAGSEGFKWGAITGAISGGAGEAIALKGATLNGLTMNEAATIQKESKYPLDVIKQFKNMDQYNICKDAGLTPMSIDGKTALVRQIDLNATDELGRTNLQRMKEGLAAIDPATGEAYELHHIGQKVDSTLAILSKSEHMQNGNNKIWHVFGQASEAHAPGNNWDAQRARFWINLAKSYM